MQENGKLKEERLSKNHVAVNIKTKEILALKLQMKKYMMEKVMPKLIEQVLENNNKDIKIKSCLGDGSYDSNENFKYLQKKRIRPAIKVRKNSIISLQKQ